MSAGSKLLPLLSVLPLPALAALLLVYPGPTMQAAARGIAIWWDVLFPALFPFSVISEMMLGFGIVHFLGTLLDPLMRPLFRIPGIGGFVVAMGFASGYPIGARLTSQLWEERLIGRDEGERLVAFTTSSDPIFLIGAVSVGFFRDAGLAPILAASHYGAALLIGLLMRFHGKPAAEVEQPIQPGAMGGARGSLLLRSFHAMHEARIRDGRPLGGLLADSLRSALQLTFVIGGLVVFFSVVLEALLLTGVTGILVGAVGSVLQLFGMPEPLSAAIVSGIFEVTLGAKTAGFTGDGVPLGYKVSVAAFVLSWGGLSVHAQVVSLLHRTNLRYAPFFAARLLHGVFAAVLVLLLWQPMQPLRQGTAQVLAASVSFADRSAYWRIAVPGSLTAFAVVIGLLAAALLVGRIARVLYARVTTPPFGR